MHHKYIFHPYHPFVTFIKKDANGFLNADGSPSLKGLVRPHSPGENPGIAAVYGVAEDAFRRLTQDPYGGEHGYEHAISSPAEFDASVTDGYVDIVDFMMDDLAEMAEQGKLSIDTKYSGEEINPDDIDGTSYSWRVRLIWHVLGHMNGQSEMAPMFRTLFLIAALESAGDVLVSMCFGGEGQAEASSGMYDCYHTALAIEAEYNIANKVRQQIGKHAVAAKLAKDKKQKAKRFVYECWCDWQSGKREYASQAIFARDMLDKKGDVLVSQASIETWCRQWKKGENLPLIEPAE